MINLIKLLFTTVVLITVALPSIAQWSSKGATEVAQQESTRTTREGNGHAANSTGSLTRASSWGLSTGQTIRISGFNSGTIDFSKGGVVTTRGTRGKKTYMSYSANGELQIRESGQSRGIRVTQNSKGGLRIRTPDNGQYVVDSRGSVRAIGRRSKYTRVTASSDGRTVTIWGRGGKTYTIPMPDK